MDLDFRPSALGLDDDVVEDTPNLDFRPSALADELSGAGNQRPPVEDGDGVSSPPAPNTSSPTDLVIDPLLAGNVTEGVDKRRRRQPKANTEQTDASVSSGGRNNPRRSDVYRGPVDPSGYPIDLDRPLVLVGEGDNQNFATEMTATVPGTALGMPMEGVFFNIPTIINGVPMSPEAAAQLTGRLITAGEIKLDAIPRFNSVEEANAAALARSQKIGELRAEEIGLASEEDRLNRIMATDGPTREKAGLNLNPSVSGVQGVPGNYTLSTPMGDVPIDDKTAATMIAQGNTFEMPNNAFMRGLGRLNQAFNVLGQEFGLKSPEEFVRRMMELDRLYPDAPPEIQKGLQEIVEAEGFADSLKAIANNPQATLSVVGESLVVSAPSLAAFIAGSAVGTPVTGAAVAGSMTFGTTYASVITDEIRSTGVDMNNEAAIMELMSDQEFWARARKRGTAYGVPIAVFDALSMGLAGKLVAGGVQAGKSGLNVTGRAVTETGLQMGLGAAGETAGQASEMAFGFRDTFTPGEIALEAVAEGPLGIAEIAVGTPGNIKAARENAFNNELAAAEAKADEDAANKAAIDLLNPSSPAYGFVDSTLPITEEPAPLDFRPSKVDAPIQSAQPENLERPDDETKPELPTTIERPDVKTDTPSLDAPNQGDSPVVPGQEEPIDVPAALRRLAGDDTPPVPPSVSDQPIPRPVVPDEPKLATPEGGDTTPVRPASDTPVTIDNPQSVLEPVGKSVNEEKPDIKTVQTPDSQANYEVETVVVELADLKQAQGILQPRDRSLSESTVEAQRRASPDQFNPDRLLDSPTTGDGAPIIARDGTIMSGNGRVLTLQEVYSNQPGSRAAYTQALQSAGVNLEGYSQPVLVRRLTDTNMTVDDLKTFADLANTDAQARMSTTEVAQRDAQRMPPQVVNLYTGGDLTSLENKPFVEAFVRQVLSPTEQGQFSRDGRLTKDAVSRMQSAILATAYEDTDTLAIMLDSTDDNIKAISNAMMSTAPQVSQLKADIASGNVRPEFDISPQIAEAAKTISSLRQRNIKPRDYFAQQDAFSETDPIVDAIIRAFYNEDLTRAKSQKFMQDVLAFYVEESGNRQSDGLFEDNTTPTDVVRAARSKAERKTDGTEGQGSLLPEDSTGDSAQTRSQQTQSTRSESGSADTRTSDTKSQQEPQKELGYDPTDNVAVAQELLNRVKALNLEGVNARVDTSGFGTDVKFNIKIPEALANQYPDDLKTSSGKIKAPLKLRAAFNINGEGNYQATPIYNQDTPAYMNVKSLLRDESIDPRATAIENEIRKIAEEVQTDDNARPESNLEASVAPGARVRDTGDFTSDPTQVVLREDGEPSTRGTKSGRVLLQEVETLRQSVYNQAFTDAGFDPALARNFTPERQFKILSDLITDKFGFKYIARPETNSYDANQALLDAYRNLQWMTHSLGLPYSAIGLENSLGLALPGRQWGGYLAAFIQSKAGPAAQTMSDVGRVPAPVIIMPKRSNSFAHEWGHALDYHIVEKFGADDGRGITGRIRSNLKADERVWLENAPKNVQEAMGDLMNAMFFENAELSYKIMDVEQKLAKTRAYEAKTGKTTKKAADLEEQLRKLREGSTRTKVSPSVYRKEAAEYAVKAQSDPNYWTRPTEMFARAFEAYVAKQVTENGGNTEFITKSDEAYSMTRDQVEGADIRLALTYPNDTDRNNIFLAMDRLMQELQAEFWTDSAAAEAPGNYDMIDARVDFAAQIKEGMGKSQIKELIAQEKAGWRARTAQIKNEKNRPVRFPEKSNFNRAYIRLEDSVISRVMYAKRGILFSIAGRYNDNKQVQNILNDLIGRVATDPGGRRKTFEGGTYEEAVEVNSRRFANTYKRIIDDYGLSELSTEELAKLRLILTADPEAQAAAALGASPNLVAAAGEIRTKILNPMYDYMRKGGLEITYLQDGSYMPRMLDNAKVEQEEAQFLYGESGVKNPNSKRGAYAMYYNVIYENELGVFEEGNTDQINALTLLARKLPLDEEVSDGVAQLRQMNNEMRKLQAQLEAANSDPEADVDAIEAQIAELQQELNSVHEEVYEALRDPFAETASQDWYTRISVQAGADPEAHAAQGRFTQKRKLPAQADSYMVDYYLDPIESLNLYIPAVARKVETEKRFGKSLVPRGRKRGVLGRGPHETIDFLEYQIQQAQLAGLDNGDAQQFRIVINKILGRDAATKDIFGKKALDYVHTYGTMALLPRAVLSSIAEPLTAGIQTGSVKKGAQTFFQVFDEALAMTSESAKERTLFYRQLANILGVVDDPSIGQMVANRLGGTLAEDPKLNARLSRFFVRTKLQGLTNAQRRSSMRTMLQFLAEVSAEYQDAGTTPQAKKRIENILQDAGIYGDNLDQFTNWMATSKEGQFKAPSLDELIGRGGELTDMGNLLAIAVGRLVDQTIQNPKSVDRPMYAEHPVGRMVFGIQSFMRAYTRNVLIGSAKKVNREYQDNGMVSAATMLGLQMIPNFALLYGGHLMVSTLREVLLNGDKLEREREDDNLVPYLMELGFMRAGFYGAFDPWINMYKSLRYEADSKTILVGASLSFYSRALDRMLGVTNRFRNSPNTVAAEYQGAVGFWDTFVTTGVSAVTSMPGPGPILGTALGVGATVATSPTVKHATIREFIKLLYGEEYRPSTRSGGRSPKSGFGSSPAFGS